MRRSFIIVFTLLISLSLLFSACAPQATPTQEAEVPMPVEQATNTTAPTTAPAEPTATMAAEATPTTASPTEAPSQEGMLPEVNPADVTGNIISAGSSTVYPLSEAIAGLFKDEGYTGDLTIDSIGSGAGLERFCKTGETDIANASRKIKDTEIEACKAIGRTPIAFRVGTDAIALVVNPENDFLTNVTLAELSMIYSDKATNWSDVNSAWPAEPIKRYAPGTDSGTYDFFIEAVLQPLYDKDATKAKEAFQKAANLQQSEDDNVLVQGVEGDKYAIGFFGFAYYKENEGKLKAISLENIVPSFDTAESGEYKLSRPLFLYSDAKILADKPQVAAFINFYLTRVNEIITEVGYFPASDAELNAARQALLDAMEGKQEGVMLPEVNPADVTGNIISAGSSTVYPLSEAIAGLFKDEGYTGDLTIDSIGSGAGLERFCKTGETDIANASRKIKDTEIEACKAIGRTPIAFRVGTDAIALVVNPENDFLTNVTLAELSMIYSDKATNWSDVNSAWPAEPIKRYAPGTDSGTYDFFIEAVLQPLYDKDATKAKEAFQKAANLQQSEDDNVLVQGVEGDKYAIGFFGFAYYKENEGKLKAISLENIVPSFDTAESGEYKLSRPLFLYSDAKILADKPQVAAFINFYLTRVNEIITEVGYFPASDAELNAARQALLDTSE